MRGTLENDVNSGDAETGWVRRAHQLFEPDTLCCSAADLSADFGSMTIKLDRSGSLDQLRGLSGVDHVHKALQSVAAMVVIGS